MDKKEVAVARFVSFCFEVLHFRHDEQKNANKNELPPQARSGSSGFLMEAQ
jgi:hypothetical protein